MRRSKRNKDEGRFVWCRKGGGMQRKKPEECEECPDVGECKEYEGFLEKRAAEPKEEEQPDPEAEVQMEEPEPEPDEVGGDAPEEDPLPFLADVDDHEDVSNNDTSGGLDPEEEEDEPAGVDEDDSDEKRAAGMEPPVGEPEPAKHDDAADQEAWTFVRTEEIGLDTIKCDPEDMTRPVHQSHVASLVESAEHFEIEVIVDEDLNLVSGAHRLEAARELGLKVISAQVYRYASPAARLRHAIKENVNHGLPYTQEEKRGLGLRLFDGGATTTDISTCLAVTERAVRKWTKPSRDKKREELASEARSLSESGATQDEIAEKLGVSRNVVRSVIGENGTCSEITIGDTADEEPADGADDGPVDGVDDGPADDDGNGENGQLSEIPIGDTAEEPESPDADDEPAVDTDASASEFDIGEPIFADVSDDASEADGDESEDEQVYPTRDGDDSGVDEQDADDRGEGDVDDVDINNNDNDNDVGAQVSDYVANAAEALTQAAKLLQDAEDDQLPPAAEFKAAYGKLKTALAEFSEAWEEKVTANR